MTLALIDYFYVWFMIICLFGILCCLFYCFPRKSPYDKALEQMEQKKQEQLKWQINRNLAAKKRKQAIFELIDNFGYRNITVDYTSDKFYVIIKINKDVLTEREIK